MDPERWRRLQALLQAAWELAPEERAAFLEERCDDPELRREIEALLSADEPADRYFDRLARESGEPSEEEGDGEDGDDPAVLVGRRLGSYRLLEPLGRGGMGVVYRAERADGAFEQEVAVKLLAMGLAGPEGHRRFLAERRILASLEHPAIARLLDAGVTEDGTPFFVMERVVGERVDRWCDSRRLGVRERVELIVRICEAVEYAHRRLIVHRDLKPANVLVTGEGEPKLLDFGVAKVLTEIEPDLTRSRGGAPLTPGWAAPEQLGGGPVTTATDTYALGGLAYLLLAGAPPHARDEGHPAAMLSRDRAEPRVPSRRFASLPAAEQVEIAARRGTSASELRRRLAGDLDAIMVRALAADAEHRYGSAGELAAELTAHLQGLPVKARPPSIGYRVGRFVGRHRAAVAAATVIALLGAALLGVSVESALSSRRQAERVAAERDRAETERAEAEAVRAFMEDVLLSADPTGGLGPAATILEGLDRIVTRYEDGEISDSPVVDGTVWLAIGSVYTRLGRFDEAETLVRRAHEVRLATFGPEHAEVAEALHELGQIDLGRAEFGAAAERFRQALEIRRTALGPLDASTGHTLAWLGWALANEGDLERARGALEESVEIFRTSPEATVDLADPLSMLGQVERLAGAPEAAERVFREALEIRQRFLPPDHTKLGESYNNLAVLLDDLGRREEAARLYRRALEIQEAIYGPDSPFVAPTLSNLGILLTALGRAEQAEAVLVRAWEIDRRALGADHLYVGIDRQNLAAHYCSVGRPEAGRRHVEATLGIYRAAMPADDWRIAAARSVRGVCLWRLGRLDRAEAELAAALERLEREFEADQVNVRLARDRLIDFYEATGRRELAESLRR